MTCASCGTEIPEGARYRPACGRRVVTDASPANAAEAAGRASGHRERKVATLLFADIVGFTGLGESHDPEVVQAVVSRAFERLKA
jgi:class 3 adenylate cyclase